MKRTTFSSYDSANYLQTDADAALFLEAALEAAGDDPAFIAHTLGVIARARNMSQLARDTGLTREGLYKALSADGNPTFATVVKVARALGLRVVFARGLPRHKPSTRLVPSGRRRPTRAVRGGERAPKVTRDDAVLTRRARRPPKRA